MFEINIIRRYNMLSGIYFRKYLRENNPWTIVSPVLQFMKYTRIEICSYLNKKTSEYPAMPDDFPYGLRSHLFLAKIFVSSLGSFHRQTFARNAFSLFCRVIFVENLDA